MSSSPRWAASRLRLFRLLLLLRLRRKMKQIWLFPLFVMGAMAQAVVPSTVGPLSCGLRLYTPGSIQEYCFYLPPAGGPLVTVCNALHQITPAMSAAS